MKKSQSLIRVILFPIAAALALATFAFAADEGDSKAVSEVDRDVSKNPLTGNTTETVTTEKSMKVGSNTKKMKSKKKKKYNKEGAQIKEETETSSEVERQ